MNQNKATEEMKSQVENITFPKLTYLADLPHWFITVIALLMISLASLIYFFVRRKREKSRSRRENFRNTSSREPRQVEYKTTQAVRLEKDIIKAKPIYASPVKNFKQPEPIIKFVLFVAAPLFALVVAYAAQGVFNSTGGGNEFQNSIWLMSMPESSRLWLGAGVYLIAMVIWFFSAPSIQINGAVTNQSTPINSQQLRYQPIRFFLLFASIGIYLVSVLLFLIGSETGFIRGLWGFGLICFILSQAPWPGIHTTSHPDAEESPRFRWQNWLVLAVILVVGFWLRFYKIATIPDDFHGDMASHGQVARDFLLGVQHNIFGFGWTNTPTIGFLPAFLTMAVFGNNIFGLQMAAVIGGTFSLFAIYLLTWRLFDSHRLAVLTTALVAINVAHIHFSRIFNMEPWPLSNFAIFLLIDGLKGRRSSSLGLAGVFLGFSLLMYTSGRALPFIMIVFFVYALVFQRLWITQNIWGLGLVVIGVLITMGPALIYYLINWGPFVSRGNEVFIFSPLALAHLLNKYHTSSPFVVLLSQIKLSLLMFNQTGDSSSQFGYPHPMFHALISPLILLGLAFALRRWKNAGMAFILIWLGIIVVMGSILTIDAPFWPRLVGIVPAAALLIAVALDQILEIAKNTLGNYAVVFVSGLMVILLVTVGYLNWNLYYQTVKSNAAAPAMVGRYIGRLPLNVTACSITSGPPLSVRETYFLAWPHKLVDIKPDAPDSDLDTCSGSSLVWVISPENIGRLDAIRARWPDGIVQKHEFVGFNYIMTFYLVGITPPESSTQSH
jgi:hypothetical protein